MTRITSPPFLAAPADHIRPEAWQVLINGQWQDLPERIAEWDYATELTLRRVVEVNDAVVREACELPGDAPLALGVTWHASGTNRRGAFPLVGIRDGRAPLFVRLAGDELGGQLHLRTPLILAENISRVSPVGAHRAGSMLWSDLVSVHLEGNSAMFPIELIDFEATGLAPADAVWYLDWNPADPTSATLGSLRLYLNAGNEAVRRAGGEPGADPESQTITSAMRFDVLRQLIEGALENDEFDDGVEYPTGTVGASMRSALRLTFGGQPVNAIRALRRTSRSDFEVRIQAASRLFGA